LQVVAGFRYFLTSLKVSFLLGLELGVFPLLCGWWLDFCTFALLGATWADRLAFLEAAPFTCALLHWLSGVIYMLQLSVFASLNREVSWIMASLRFVGSLRCA
jgi:E3 ubiquitin-protein ligase MARCH6